MLSARAEQMEMVVLKASSSYDMWTGHPLVFRIVALPLYVIGVLYFSLDDQLGQIVILGDEGEEVNLQNDDALVTDDDPDCVEARAFVAESVYGLGLEDVNDRLHVPYSVLMALQTVIWCLFGTPTVLVLFGDDGGRVPDWGWETEKQGPHLQSVRITPFGTSEV